MLERIKTIITTSWSAAVDQTEKNIREIFNANTVLSPGMFSCSPLTRRLEYGVAYFHGIYFTI